jgi:hypothetical protein
MSGQIHPSVILEHKISNVKHQIEPLGVTLDL